MYQNFQKIQKLMSHLEFDTKLVNIHSSLKPAAYNLTRDITEAEDLIQETMVKAISNREKFREGTNLNAWMYTIMRNTFITKYNRTVRRKIGSLYKPEQD